MPESIPRRETHENGGITMKKRLSALTALIMTLAMTGSMAVSVAVVVGAGLSDWFSVAGAELSVVASEDTTISSVSALSVFSVFAEQPAVIPAMQQINTAVIKITASVLSVKLLFFFLIGFMEEL